METDGWWIAPREIERIGDVDERLVRKLCWRQLRHVASDDSLRAVDDEVAEGRGFGKVPAFCSGSLSKAEDFSLSAERAPIMTSWPIFDELAREGLAAAPVPSTPIFMVVFRLVLFHPPSMMRACPVV